MGWKYLIIWECESKDEQMIAQKIKEFLDVREDG